MVKLLQASLRGLGFILRASLFLTIGLYAVGVILMTYYGIEVCPFLETLVVSDLMLEFVVAFVSAVVGRFAVLKHLKGKSEKVPVYGLKNA